MVKSFLFLTMSKHDLPPERVIRICDYVNAGKTNEEKTQRREKMAEAHGLSAETINAITAHIEIRRNEAIDRVGVILKARNLRQKRAAEALAFAQEKKLTNARALEAGLESSTDAMGEAMHGEALLEAGDLRGAIEAFAAQHDTQVLEEIAAIYAKSRPDLAALALQAAGSVDGVLELAALQLRAGNRLVARKILEVTPK